MKLEICKWVFQKPYSELKQVIKIPTNLQKEKNEEKGERTMNVSDRESKRVWVGVSELVVENFNQRKRAIWNFPNIA